MGVGRGKKVEGMWISDQNIPSELRVQDKFLSYLRANLSNSVLVKINLDHKDRILEMVYHRWGKENSFFLFFNKKALNFVNYAFQQKKENYFYLKSWENKPVKWSERIDFSIFDEVGRKDLSHKDRTKIITPFSDILDKERKELKRKSEGSKTKNRLKRKIENIEKDLKKIRSYEGLLKLVESEQDFSTYPKKYKYDGLKISFDYPDHYKRRDQLYRKIKNLKRAEPLVASRLASAKESLQKGSAAVEQSTLAPIAPAWNKDKPTRKSAKDNVNIDYKVFQFDDYKIGVGTTSKGNDALRIDWASKNDVWFHLDGDTSAHAIVKSEDLELTEQLFDVVASIILEFSKLDFSHANLIYTKVKDLKGVKGVPGKVIFKKEKRYYAKKIDWSHLLVS